MQYADTHADKLQKVGNSWHGPANHEARDHGDHRLENIQLRARQFVASCRCSRLPMNLPSVLFTWRGCHGNILTTSGVTADHLALSSDCVKYTRVAESEDAHRNCVLPEKPRGRKCLWDKLNCCERNVVFLLITREWVTFLNVRNDKQWRTVVESNKYQFKSTRLSPSLRTVSVKRPAQLQ